MKIRLLSDIHIEFADFKASTTGADVVILAGDIHVGTKGIDWINAQAFDCPVIYVLGNHEYYSHKYPGLVAKMKHKAQNTNIFVLEKDSIAFDGVRFHGVTMWTDFNLFGTPELSGYACQQIMNDYRKIRREPSYSKLRTVDVSMIHLQSRRWLEESLRSSDCKTNVVVTHHAPSIHSIPESYREDKATPAYASDLESFIHNYRPDYWFHGHVHESANYTIGSCNVRCNPRGYSHHLNKGFNPELLVSI